MDLGKTTGNGNESFRASIKRKLRQSFRRERKGSNASQRSLEDEENKKSEWYHHEIPAGYTDHMDPLEHIFNDDDDDFEEENIHDIDEYKLNPETMEKLKDSWKTLQERISTIGVVTFLSIFETHPDTLNSFLPQIEIDSLSEMKMDKLYKEKLRVHGLRVMSIVEKTMHRLDNNRKCLQMLKYYGKKHERVGIPASLLGYMGRSFMAAIEPTLTESNAWNPETEEAWQKLLKWITYGMQRGYDSGSTGQNKDKDQQKPLEEENQISTKIPPPISLAEVAENLQAIDVDGGDDDPNSTTSIEDENT